ncbi:hypothetical protein [Brevibacillus daliensis]|uniref:hypothetical protein n=1 Tax=Brevibacillus daliensis TaxID=2892995 RepID=UPI001E3CBBA6|nr:hypothetical protein [Brevibacillus daliensis]
MDEGSSVATDPVEQPGETEEIPQEDFNSGGGSSGDDVGSDYVEPDWNKVSDTFANKFQSKQATFEVVHFDSYDLRIEKSATTGDLLVTFSILAAISVFLLKWVFQIIWRRR